MSPILIATIAGLVTAVCWGASDWLASRSTKKLNPLEVGFAVEIGGLLVIAILLLFSRMQIPDLNELWKIVAGNVLITIAYLLFVKALTTGAVGIIVPIGNSFPLVTVILSVIFLSVTFTLGQFGAMVVIVLGAAILAYEKNHMQIPLQELHKDTMLAFLAMLIWGLAFFILDPVVGKISWQTFAIFSQIVTFCTAILLLLTVYRSKAIRTIRKSLSSRAAITAGTIGGTGFAALYLGSDRSGSIIIPTVLSAGAPLVASFLGAIYDKEKIGVFKRVGAVLIVIGIIILNLN